jgi:predicted O-methyltransferase YrrM
MPIKVSLTTPLKKILSLLGLECQTRRMWRWMLGKGKILPSDAIKSLKNRHLKAIASQFNSPLIEVPHHEVPGWLSANEQRALYVIARRTDGPFLEVGPWVGLSTCYIASAIRDGGKAKRFVAAELNPTMDYYRLSGSVYHMFLPTEPHAPAARIPKDFFETEIVPIITSPEGVVGALAKNLIRCGLDKYVEVVAGDFAQVAPKLKYSFVFADVMHSPDKIARQAPALRELLSPGAILACHDVTYEPGNEAAIKEHFPVAESFIVDSLFIGKIA